MADDNPSKMLDRLCQEATSVAHVNYKVGYGEGGPPTFYIDVEIEWRNWEWIIRRILTAMREPTEAMSAAAFEAAGSPSDWPGFDEMWGAAIDAALKE